jgi:hypothetical protein
MMTLYKTGDTDKNVTYHVIYVTTNECLVATVVRLKHDYVSNMATLGYGVRECLTYKLHGRLGNFSRLADFGDLYG